ncbi:MAG TPA: glycosyltransferase family 39 protein, partial [Candidatus Hydrogenedentes bacterium]|nr:glycosyltransferase family 39 protein [Candidatus Hydrogenedentota bacterium]
MTAPPGGAPERFGARDALLLAGLLGLALGTRAAGIASESAWWDEYTSVMHLDAPSLGRFLSLNRTLDPLTLPLYYTLEYLWWHFVSATLPGLRALSVLLSLATVAAFYTLARRLTGRAGAAAAGLCLALSPVHAHHGQGIRMYVLFILLALLSWMTLLELVRRPGWGRWCAHAPTLFLLFWVHPFALLVGGAQAAWVVLLRPLSAVGTVRWLALFLAAAAPPGMYLRTVRFWPKQSTDQWISLPGPGEFLADLFADDVVSYTWQLRVSGFGEMLGGARGLFDAALALLMVAGLAVVFVQALRGYAGAGRGRCLSGEPVPDPSFPRTRESILDAAAMPQREDMGPRFRGGDGQGGGGTVGDGQGGTVVLAWHADPFRRSAVLGLFLWVLAPPLALYLASVLVRPCIFPRYTVHCSLAVYLLLGVAVETLPRRGMRALAVAALAGLLAVQWGVTLPGPQRTDWRGAARALAAEAKPAAGPDTAPTVLVYGSLWRDVFEYNRRIEPMAAQWENPVAAGENGAVLARLAAFYLEAGRRRGAGADAVWLVAAGEYFAETPPDDLASELARWG